MHFLLAALVSLCLLLVHGVAEASTVLEARRVIPLQSEPDGSPYDWGPSLMRDDDGLYKMWWTRLGGPNDQRFPHRGITEDGKDHAFTYPNYGDRIYYAESRDGVHWNINGPDYAGALEDYGPTSRGPALVLSPAESEQEFYHLGRPCVVKVDGVYYMYYEACSAYWFRKDGEGRYTQSGEFQNQVFLATSPDGRRWTKHPNNDDPQPVIEAPAWNLEPGHWRYGLGQPSVYVRDGRFVVHYVDSCTGPGDFMVRIEADNPRFENARVQHHDLASVAGLQGVPKGAVSRHAQTQMACFEDAVYLVRAAYDTPNLGVLGTRNGVFTADAAHDHPKNVFPQVAITDPRGDDYTVRLFPCFLRTPAGALLPENGHAVMLFTSAAGFKDAIGTWDLFRCEVPMTALQEATGTTPARRGEAPSARTLRNAPDAPDPNRLPRFFSSSPDYDAFVNEYFTRHLSIDEHGVYQSSHGPVLGTVNHMWVIEWDWWYFPWIDRAAMGKRRMNGGHDVIQSTLLDVPVDRHGYTWGGPLHTEQNSATMSYMPLYGWPWPKYDRNYTVERPTGWEFNDLADGARDAWSATDMVLDEGYVDHCLHGTIRGSNPELVSPAFDVDAFHVPIVSLDIAYEPSDTTAADNLVDRLELYWTTAESPTWSRDRMVTVNFSSLSPSQFPHYYAPLVQTGKARYPLYFPMHLHPGWGRGGRRITRLKIVPTGTNAAGTRIALNYARCTYDTRLTTTNATLINATARFYLWSGDLAFLDAQMPRLRRAMMFLNEHLGGREHGMLTQDWWVGKDGIGGQTGHGLYGNYWDLLPGGRQDIESNAAYYAALRHMAELERVAKREGIGGPAVSVIGPDNVTPITYTETPATLEALAGRVKENTERVLWNLDTQRFAKGIDSRGELHDYGYLHFNLLALATGLGTREQRSSILSWLTGQRTVPGDTAQGEDIYRWRFAPRISTKRNGDWYYWAWLHDRAGDAKDSHLFKWGHQMQDGGGVPFTFLFDMMARTHSGDQAAIDEAYRKSLDVKAWFEDVLAAGGDGPDLYRAYYDGHPERGTLQSPNPGGLGLHREFLSDGSLGTQFVYHAFLGVSTRDDGVLILRPAVPTQLDYVGVDNVFFRGHHLRIEAGHGYVSVKPHEPIDTSSNLRLRLVLPAAPTDTVAATIPKAELTQSSYHDGALCLETALGQVRIEYDRAE